MSITSAEIITKLIDGAPKREKSEYMNIAASVLDTVRNTGNPARIVSLTCANYETRIARDGSKIPILHKDLVWDERSWGNYLRRGYVAAHEEIPAVLEQLLLNNIPARHTVVLVDHGMAPQLWGEKAQKYLGMDEAQIKDNIAQTVHDNVDKFGSMERDGLTRRGLDENIARVVCLSHVEELLNDRDVDFGQYWTSVIQSMYGLVDTPHHRVAGLIRHALKKDASYLRHAWGMTNDSEIKHRVIDQTFALTAALGHLLPEIEAAVWNDTPVARDELIMVDTIPGPDNPGHTEFRMYNTPFTEITGTSLPPIPIMRPLRNTVLFSQDAVESTITGKKLYQIENEANELGY